MKNPMRPAGIEPATLRFVAQHLNHCATTIPELQGEQHILMSRHRKEMVLRYLNECSYSATLDKFL